MESASPDSCAADALRAPPPLAGETIAVPRVIPLRGLRLALPKNGVLEDMDATVSRAFQRALEKLSQHGAQIIEIALPELDEVIATADVVIVGKQLAETATLRQRLRAGQTVIDLVGIPELGDVIRPWSSPRTAALRAPVPKVP